MTSRGRAILSVALIGAAALVAERTPAQAFIVAPWQLEESHFFQWSDWRDVFEFGPCNKIIPYRMNNAPPKRPDAPAFDGGLAPDAPAWTPPYIEPPSPPIGPSSPVPEPSTWAMLVMGLGGLVFFKRNRFLAKE